MPDTSNSSYVAVTDQVRHCRNCSSRNLLWHKKQRQSSHQDLMPEPHARTPRRISIDHRKGPSKGFRRISTGSPPDLLTRACTRSCQDLLEDFTRIPTRSSHKDLYKSMQGFCEEGSFFDKEVDKIMQGHRRGFTTILTRSSCKEW